MGRFARWIGLALFLALPASACVYPLIDFLYQAATEPASSGPLVVVPWRLLLKSSGLAALGATGALLLGVIAAFLIGAARPRHSPAILLGCAIPILFPTMVYAIGWDGVLHVPGPVRCVFTWVTWTWPIPALLLAAGWRRAAAESYAVALLDAGSPRAFIRTALPILSSQAVSSWLLLFALLLADYNAPHACSMIVYATALLDAATTSYAARDVLLPAAPGLIAISVALAGAAVLYRRAPRIEQDSQLSAPGARRPWAWGLPLFAIACISVPLFQLGRRAAIVPALAGAWRVYNQEILTSMAFSGGVAVLVTVVGGVLAGVRRLRFVLIIVAIAFAALPGAVVGQMIVVSWIRVPAVYGTWFLPVLGYFARFIWIGLLAGWLARASIASTTADAARLDAAGPVASIWTLVFRPQAALFVACWAIVTALSLADITVSALVRTPEFNPIALILVEKFHRFEDDMLVALSLIITAAALPAAVLVALVGALRRS